MTAPRPATAAAALIERRRRWARWPGGRGLFDRLIWLMIPYTGSVRPRIETLEPGLARVTLRDRRRLRNHLRSVHAIALANVGEYTGGLALTATLPPTLRSIIVRLTVEYRKKARGRLTAECRCAVPMRFSEDTALEIRTTITDGAGDVVAVTTATWRVGPIG